MYYTELIILEYRDRTDLADGKYDGKINMQDVTQIELIIPGKEKELTIVDAAARMVTLDIPIESIAVMYPAIDEVAIAMGQRIRSSQLTKLQKIDPTSIHS